MYGKMAQKFSEKEEEPFYYWYINTAVAPLTHQN